MDKEFTLHRKRPGMDSDKVTASGTKEHLLRQFLNVPPSDREQYSMMQGGMEWSHREMEAMSQKSDKPTDSIEE
jgi:hypothetical protein